MLGFSRSRCQRALKFQAVDIVTVRIKQWFQQWLTRAIESQKEADPKRFDEMDEEGWNE